MIISGIGVDIEDVGRFRKLIYKNNPTFYKRAFTNKEIRYCLAKTDSCQHFAARFAAKEAVVKALRSTIYKAKSIEVLNRRDGSPRVKVKNQKSKVKIMASLSHTKEYAVAIALVAKP